MPNSVSAIVRGCFLGMILTLCCILLFALLLKIGLFGEGAIPITNQIIKIAGIAVAAMIACRGQGEKKWLYGGIGGFSYIVFGIALFAAIEAEFNPSVLLLSDLAMGAIAGIIVGLIMQKLKN